MTQAKLIESTEEFVVILERSQLFAANQLEAIKKLAENTEDAMPIARALIKKGWLSKWQASQLLSGFHNLTLGKYRLADHLGKGELGNVYLAENPKLGRQVALKTLSKKHTDAPEVVKRFLDEARAAAALDHRNIVHVHDVSSENQRHYVVMEYVSGRDLQARVDADGQLSFDDAAGIIRQAAEGLLFAHEQGVVHRHIKPANIMVDSQGVVKILDIGVGHLRQSASNPSENTGELMMSAIAYMAPEHARGREVDARCDIYSLGGVLYFLLTARVPFTAKTDAERAKIKASKQSVPLTDLRADTPQALVDLCDRMMVLTPGDRCASMADVLAALDNTDDRTPDVLSTSDDADIAVAEPADVEMAEPEIEDLPEVEKAEPVADSKAAASALNIDFGETAKPAAAGTPTDFAINTKRRKQKKKPAAKRVPAPEAAAQEPVEEEAPEPAAAAESPSAADDQPELAGAEAKRGLSRGLIIGGACAAGLLLLVGVGVGAVMLFGGGETEVAQATPAATASADAADDAASDDPAGTTASDAAEGGDDSAAALDPFADPDAAATTQAEAISDSATGDTSAVASENSTEPNEDTGDTGAADSAPSPDASAAAAEVVSETTPAAAETESAGAGPVAESPAVEQPAAEKPAAEKKPAPQAKKQASAKQTPPEPKTFVFKPAVDLPTPAPDAPELTLGQINIGAQDAVFISLDGGDIAVTGQTEFSVQNAQDGVAPRDWEFYLSDGKSDPTVIATMSLSNNDLKFKWTAACSGHSTATNLRNCSLKITAGQARPQDLALRTPQKVAPVTIDVERSATARLPLEGAPDRRSLKLEVTVKGHKSMVEPAQIELGRGGDAIIYFGENREQAAFALKLDASINARGVQIKTNPYFLVPGDPSPVRLNKRSIKTYQAAQAQQAGLQTQVFQRERAVKSKKLAPQQKQRLQLTLGPMKQQLELINKTVEKMVQLQADMAAIGAGASLHFRVFSDTFEKQIDLIVTDPNAAPAAP